MRPGKTFVEDPSDMDWEPDYSNFIVTGKGGIAMAYDMHGAIESEWNLPDEANIVTGTTSEDSCYLISQESQLYEYSITNLEFMDDHGKCFEQTIRKFAINDRYVFGCTASNVILKYSLIEKQPLESLGKLVDGNVSEIYASKEFLWIADDQNNLKQYHIDLDQTLQVYPEIFEAPIVIMGHFKTTLVAVDRSNNMKLFSAGNKKVRCDFGSLNWDLDQDNKAMSVEGGGDEEDSETITALTMNNYFVFTGSSKGNVKQWHIKTKSLVHVYKDDMNVLIGCSMHDKPVTCLKVWKTQFMLSASTFGDFIRYDFDKRELVKKYGKVVERLDCILLG
jgi:WD40 repeat protein